MHLFERNTWRKAAQQYLYENHPELVPLFSSKIVDQACAYMRGYSDSLKKNTNPPHNLTDMIDDVRDSGIKESIRIIRQSNEK